MKAQVIIKSGQSAGGSVAVDRLGSYTIGRRSENSLCLADKCISRKHCRIDYDGEFFWLVDCDSHNGTFVNGERVTRCMLYDGDQIRLGKIELGFSAPRADEGDGY